MPVRWHWYLAVLFAALLAARPESAAAIDFNEGLLGDLSSNGSAPTSWGTLSPGLNTLTAAFGAGDFDLITFVVADGQQLDAISLVNYNGSSLSFTGIQAGATWDAGFDTSVNPAGLLGWTHISSALVGTNILDDYALGEGAIGFTPPLSAGSYTIELQDTSSIVSASLSFHIVPEPSSLLLATLGLAIAGVWRRRRAA